MQLRFKLKKINSLYLIEGFGAMSGGFGATSQSGSTGLFGKPITNFGTPATTTSNSFAFNSTSNTNLFGTNSQAKPFGGKLHYICYP